MTARQLLSALLFVGLGFALAWLLPSPAGLTEPASDPDGPCPDGSQPAYWVAPMDPAYRREGPGKSPMGMDLVPYCGRQESSAADVEIRPQILQNLGVLTARAVQGPMQRTLRAVGRVSYDESSYQMIHARAEGWVEQLAVEFSGATIVAGAPLYTLFAPKLVSAESEYLSALDGAGTALRQAARQRLLALGFDEPQIAALERRRRPSQRLTPQAAADGVVAALGVRRGQHVSPGSHLMTLASLDQVWVLVDVPERDAGLLRPGLPATVRLDAFPGREWPGLIDYIYPELDPKTRSVQLRLRLENPGHELRPNMFAEVRIRATIADQVLQIPSSAVLRDARGDRVVQAVGENGFRIVPVKVGHRFDGRSQILQGLNAGDRVVVDGQFMIDAEANLDAEALRLRAQPLADPPRGATMARIIGLEADGIVLEHDPIEALGTPGISMPGMQMRFGLDPAVDTAGLREGQQVHAIIEQRGPGNFVVTELHHGESRP